MSLARLSKKKKEEAQANEKAGVSVAKSLSPAEDRIRRDMDDLSLVSSQVDYQPEYDSYTIRVTVHPKKGIWKGGAFPFSIALSPNYPIESPRVRYLGPTRVFHPNIEGDADRKDWGVCLSLQTEWRPSLTISDIILNMESLFAEPNYDDALPGVAKQAAQMLKDNPAQFEKIAHRWMRGEYVIS